MKTESLLRYFVLAGFLLVSSGAPRVWARSAVELDRETAKAEQFDINAPANTFDLLGDFEGTTIIFKVCDSSGVKRGVLKLPSPASNYRGEIAAHRIARYLEITIFPATVHKFLDAGTAKRLKGILKSRKFATARKDHHKRAIETKERHRQDAILRLEQDADPDGCFKEWLDNIQFISEIGTRKAIGAHRVMTYLKADGPAPPEGAARFKQCTYLMSEKGCFTGSIGWARLAGDVSDMMLVDALSGNLDRFPGGNIHMRSLDGGSERSAAGINFPKAELLALDNGATFMGRSSRNLDDLTGRRVEATRVERFVKGRYEKLLELRELVRTDPDSARKKLFLVKFRDPSGKNIDMLEQFAGNLDAVLDYMDSNREKFGTRTILP
jgi:hypothetical protein